MGSGNGVRERGQGAGLGSRAGSGVREWGYEVGSGTRVRE